MSFPTVPGAALLRRARARLKQGGVIAYATESCFGLGCDPRNARALARVIRLKRRPGHKGLIVLAADIDQLRGLIRPLSESEKRELARYWPGHYTFLLPAAPGVLPALRGHHDKIAVRISAHCQATTLCRLLGTALVSTSANRSGQHSLTTTRACRRAFGDRALVLPGRVGKARRPSTIIDLATGRVLR
jgi:L-threonylcarbamoyladenylate synthase